MQRERLNLKKPHASLTSVKLEHNSLYNILKRTNKQFSYGIALESNVKDMKISLTFRHLLTNPVYLLMKKPILQKNPPMKNVS